MVTDEEEGFSEKLSLISVLCKLSTKESSDKSTLDAKKPKIYRTSTFKLLYETRSVFFANFFDFYNFLVLYNLPLFSMDQLSFFTS